MIEKYAENEGGRIRGSGLVARDSLKLKVPKVSKVS